MVKKQQIRQIPREDYLLTAVEAANTLRISRSALYSLVQRGDIIAVHIGRALRFRSQDIQAYIHGLDEQPAQDPNTASTRGG